MVREHGTPWTWSCGTTRRRNTIFLAMRARSATWTGRISRIRFDDTKDRRFVALPRLKPDDAPRLAALRRLVSRSSNRQRSGHASASLSRFLEYSLAISAWKQAGEVRWALRTNPSSGNLHPTEGYLLIDGVAQAFRHSRVFITMRPRSMRWSCGQSGRRTSFDSLMQSISAQAPFFVGFTSVNWRETWKYGERAFRYCQHDVGHAIGSARIAAQTLGWRMVLLDGVADDTVAALLGVDRPEDFDGAEREHPDCLAVVWPADQACRSCRWTDHLAAACRSPLMLFATGRDIVGTARPTGLSRDDPVPWEILKQVEVASWKSSTERQGRRTESRPSCRGERD